MRKRYRLFLLSLVPAFLFGSVSAVVQAQNAGTPAVSDPGCRVVRAAMEAQLPVSPIPGANAAVAAISAAGLRAERFLFLGFLPAAAKARRDLIARHARLRGLELDPKFVPQLIDEIPILAVLATQAEGKTAITGASELRVKESDRLAALTKNLRAMGVSVEELPDGLIIQGPARLRGANIDSCGDHLA